MLPIDLLQGRVVSIQNDMMQSQWCFEVQMRTRHRQSLNAYKQVRPTDSSHCITNSALRIACNDRLVLHLL